MILLSEVAEKVRNEVRSWPGDRGRTLDIRCTPPLRDARDGDERSLIELLTLIIGLNPYREEMLILEITGTDEEITIRTVDPSGEDTDWVFSEDSLRGKAKEWKPRIETGKRGLAITLSMKASSADPPMDVGTMARETGIGWEDAMSIADGFMSSGRCHMNALSGKGDEQYRAAHSLKGAGKTLRAPELAAAARAMEQSLRDRTDTKPAFERLESAWRHLEHWMNEEKS